MLFKTAPKRLCIIRLSAIGDVAHVIAVVQAIQEHWPHTEITWIVGKIEYQLVKMLPKVHFIQFDKKHNFRSYLSIFKQLGKIQYDALLMMQPALRASVISLLLKARYKVGFDKARSKDAQTWFSNYQINGPVRVHVVDTFLQFLEVLGLSIKKPIWTLPLEQSAKQFALTQGAKNGIVINPNSSVARRNWTVKGYAEVINYLTEKLQKSVIITGAANAKEQTFNRRILSHCQTSPLITDLTGQTNLQQLAAIIEQAQLVIAPDTGPAHIATAVNTPVVSLFADTNPDRARPYNSASLCVNAYPEAVKHFHQAQVANKPWGFRVRIDGVMNLITVDQVIQQINKALKI